MPCYHPLDGYRSKTVNPSGKRSIVFNLQEAYRDLEVKLPCGQCIGCRLDRSRKWAVRCMHEASLYEDNAFITLTYRKENLPKNGSLDVKHFQDFMKRLREPSCWPDETRPYIENRKVRFFHCGEYGEIHLRPHYHACLFNLDFPDKTYWQTVNGQDYYRSATLEKLWPAGNSMIGQVTFDSAAYVARYITKKITGERADWYYKEENPDTGEVISLKPEYVTMSRGKGIGYGWFEKYKSDLYPDDFVVVPGKNKAKKCRIPKYYDQLLEREAPLEFAKIQAKRKVGAHAHEENNTPRRLEVREEVQILKFQRLIRTLEK